MFAKKDVQWWISEVQKHPESAVDLVRMLGDRLDFLDRQNEELRAELIALKRTHRGGDIDALRERIEELESAAKAGSSSAAQPRLIAYRQDRIEANLNLNTANSIGRELTDLDARVSLLVCTPSARLLALTAESRVFSLSASDLARPENEPVMLGTPNDLAAIIDQSAFDRRRFVIVLTQQGYIYSQIGGAAVNIARQQEKLICNLRPDDRIVYAAPSSNADLFAISTKGRWIRFSEKVITGEGNQVMKLADGDEVIQVIPLAEEMNLTFVTADGKLFVRPSTTLTARKAPGSAGGVLFKNSQMLGVSAAQELVILTQKGKVIRIYTRELPFRAQTDSGVIVPGLATDDTVIAFTSL